MHSSDGEQSCSGSPCINLSSLCSPTGDTNVWDEQVWTAFHYRGAEVLLSSHYYHTRAKTEMFEPLICLQLGPQPNLPTFDSEVKDARARPAPEVRPHTMAPMLVVQLQVGSSQQYQCSPPGYTPREIHRRYPGCLPRLCAAG